MRIRFGCSSSSGAPVQTRAVLFEDVTLLSRPWDWLLHDRRPEGLESFRIIGHGIRRLARCSSVSSLCISKTHRGEEFSGCGSSTTWRPLFHVSRFAGARRLRGLDGGIRSVSRSRSGVLLLNVQLQLAQHDSSHAWSLSHACLRVLNQCRMSGVEVGLDSRFGPRGNGRIRASVTSSLAFMI